MQVAIIGLDIAKHERRKHGDHHRADQEVADLQKQRQAEDRASR